ncbi:MAG: restriction endonuclease subunit S [Candidatus Bathyarchaeota archaeon]|nr:restriction endonuclease subunit S [Candidatus Bathyarchaeota archaeon]
MTLRITLQDLFASPSNPLIQIHSSWERVPLSSVAEILNGFAFESSNFSETTGFPLLRIRDIYNDKTECFFQGPYDQKYVIKKGDLLVGMDGDFNCARWTGPDALLNQRVCKISVKSQFYDDKFLELVLPGYLNEINKNTSSVTVKHISSKTIGSIPLPLPPLNEQKRISSHIMMLLAESKTSREYLNNVLSLLQKFRQAVLSKAFRGEYTKGESDEASAQTILKQIRKERDEKKHIQSKESGTPEMPKLPKKWLWTTIGDIFDVSSGGTPRRNRPEYWNGNIPWVSSGEVAFKDITETNECITKEGLDNSSAKLYPPGTVLLALYGEGKTRGQAAILRISATTNQAIACIQSSKTNMLPEYLYWWLYFRYIETRRLGVGANQPNMYLHDVRSMIFPLAPISEQKSTISRICELFAFANEIETLVKKGKSKNDCIDETILAKAFVGKLIPQNRDDEPASILLKRIEAEAAKTRIYTRQQSKERPQSKRLKESEKTKTLEAILKEIGPATIERTYEASGLSMEDFWDKLKAETDAGRIKKSRNGNLTYLKADK